MSKKPAPDKDAADAARAAAGAARSGARRVRTPLTPAHVGHAIGDDADPEQDVAPNLGGEEQMQDA